MKLNTILSFALLCRFDAQAQELIWSTNHTVSTGWTIGGGPLESWQIAFDHVSNPSSTTPPSQNPSTRIFTMRLFTNDTGRTFFANALNESGFAGFVAGITDGVNNYIRFQSPFPSSWELGLEQPYLGRSALAPDFAGYAITQIGFRVNSFYDWYDGTEDRYFKKLDYSLDFYGTPILFIQRGGASQLEVLWSTNATGFTLESASTLPASSWSSVTNSPQIVGSRFVVSLDMIFQQRFFRLHKE
jgi:hypothetical protein